MNPVRRLLFGTSSVRRCSSVLFRGMSSTNSKPDEINSGNNDKYIDDRVNNLFNIILADIISSQQFNQPKKTQITTYQNPYDSKDQILRDLVTNPENVNHQYSIQELIEEEFQMEISDKEFEQFKTLKDIVAYISQRLEIRNQLMSTHSPDYAYSSYWY